MTSRQKLESYLLIGHGYHPKIKVNLNVSLLDVWLTEIPENEIILCLNATSTNLFPRLHRDNYTVANVLCACMRSDNPSLKSLAYGLFPSLCSSSSFLFFCIATSIAIEKRKLNDSTGKRVWGEGFRKAIKKWYDSKDNISLTKMLISSHSEFNWSHKDVMKLIHYRCTTPERNAIIDYFVFQKKAARKELDCDCEKLALYYDELKTSEDSPRVVFLLQQLGINLSPSVSCNKSPEVWLGYLENLPPEDLLNSLEYFTSYEKMRNTVLPRAVAILGDIKGEIIDPITVNLSLHCYETCNYQLRKRQAIKNSKDVKTDSAATDKKERTPYKADRTVVNALKSLLVRSCSALQKTNEDWLLVFNFENGGAKYVRDWHVSYTVLAKAITMYARSVARNVEFVVPGQSVSDDITDDQLTGCLNKKANKISFADTLLAKTKAVKIIFLSDVSLGTDQEIIDAVISYREKKSLPNASLLVFGQQRSSEIIHEGIWKFSGFHPAIIPTFCSHSKGELRLFQNI